MTARLSRCKALLHRGRHAGLGMTLLLLLAGCVFDGGDDDKAARSVDRVTFEAPEVVTQARVLSGDPSSGRCSDASQPCFKDDKDILKRKRTVAGIHDIQVSLVSLLDSGEINNVVATLPTENTTYHPLQLAGTRWEYFFPYLRTVALSARLGETVDAKPRDSLLRLQLFDDGAQGLNVYMVGQKEFPRAGVALHLERKTGSSALHAAAADFDGSGVDQIVFVAGDWIQVTAPKLTDGLVTSFVNGALLGIGPTLALKTADFFGTGPLAVAAVNDNGTLQVQFFGIDAKTKGISFMGDKTVNVTLRPGHTVNMGSVHLVAGKFTNPSYDQVALVFEELDPSAKPLGSTFVLIDRDASGLPRSNVKSQVVTARDGTQLQDLRTWLDKGRFLAGDPFEGLVLLRQSGQHGNNMRTDAYLVGYASDNTPAVKATANDPSTDVCNFGIAVGNFDRKVTRDDGTQQASLDMQVALLRGEQCAGGVTDKIAVSVWQASPLAGGGGAPELRGVGPSSRLLIPTNDARAPIPNPIVGLQIVAIDLQARSKVLGPPKIVTIENLSQPSVIVAAPPMHADWVGGKLVNYSAAPDGFFSKYTTSDSTDAEGTSKSTTTWSFSAEESAEATIGEGSCNLGDCASIGFALSAKQDLDGNTSALRGRFSTQNLEISQQTSFNDIVWFKDSTLTIYIYPVIGQSTCPAAKPNCSPSQRVPVTLAVAGPDTVVQSHADGHLLPWYQPPWVSGHVLSYPATVGQLKTAALADPAQFKPLTDERRWSLDATEVEEKATWRSGGRNANSVELNGNFSFHASTSYHERLGLDGVATADIKLGFSLGASAGFKNLTESKTTVTKASGLSFTKKALFEQPEQYSYWLTPYIFAQNIPPTATSADTTFDGFGALQSGFSVDLLALGAGPLWKNEYTAAPDLALLHPSRRVVGVSNAPITGEPQRCVRYGALGSAYNCVDEAERRPERPGDDAYHWMRGFFISEAQAPGQGPLKSSATAGDKLMLQVRVHNLSLAPMPAGTIVKARISGMAWDSQTNMQVGKSFVIGTGTAGVVQPYQTINDTPNWVLVSVPFDTTPHAGKDLRFWVVTWMENANGRLVAERTDRGLSAIPPADADFADVAALEAPYGNNVGFFNMPFHVFEPNTPNATAAAVTATKPSLTITQVGSEDRQLTQGKSTMVAARVKVGDHDLRNGVKVVFYDKAPGSGGRVIGIQHQPFMRAGATYDFRVPFRPQACGTHQVHVVTGPGTRFEHSVRLKPIELRCS